MQVDGDGVKSERYNDSNCSARPGPVESAVAQEIDSSITSCNAVSTFPGVGR